MALPAGVALRMSTPPSALFAFEELLYAIRRDLGNGDQQMARGDLLRVSINDIDELLVQQQAR